MKAFITILALTAGLLLTTSTQVEAKPKYAKSNYSKCKHKKLKPAIVWYGGSVKSKSKILR